MNTSNTHLRATAWLAIAGLANFLVQPAVATQQQQLKVLSRNAVQLDIQREKPGPSHNQPVTPAQSSYLLGPGDSVIVELMDVPEYSGIFTIGPDGNLYLPRLRSLSVEGMSIKELTQFLEQEFSKYVHEPQVFVNVATFRAIRVYIGGEVARPGYYYLSGEQSLMNQITLPNTTTSLSQTGSQEQSTNPFDNLKSQYNRLRAPSGFRLPTVFDALRTAGGVTPFSKLSEVSVTRKRSVGSGGGKIRTTLDFLTLITDGNESQNIRLFDGDSIVVARSPVELREQIIKAGQTNLSPDFVPVFVTGRVRDPGTKVIPQGSSLDQALAAAGGQKIIRGQVEFIRFNRDGSTDQRKFFIGGTNPAGSYKNPILMAGDVVRVTESPLSATLKIINEITLPAVGVYSILNLFNDK